jgi:hypothetical protein
VATEMAFAPVRGTLWNRIVGAGAFGAFAIGFGLWIATRPDPRFISGAILIACGVFFLAVAAGFARRVFEPWGLMADAQGFSYGHIWKRESVAWRDASEFSVVKYRSIQVIGFDLRGAPETTTRRINKQTMGVSDYIFAHNFSAGIEDVCEQLNALRRRSVAP